MEEEEPEGPEYPVRIVVPPAVVASEEVLKEPGLPTSVLDLAVVYVYVCAFTLNPIPSKRMNDNK